MSEICELTNAKQIIAFYVPGFLVFNAQGVRRSNICYKVKIKQSPYRIYPPMYDLLQCIKEGTICTQQYPPPIDIWEIVPSFEPPEDYIYVNTRDGREKVEVVKIKAAADSTAASAFGGGREGGALPSPFALAGVPGLFKHFGRGGETAEGSAGDELERLEATGYSENFKFDEAFQDAIRQLPASDIADWQDVIRVDDVGAIMGGIAGVRVMYVRISTYRLKTSGAETRSGRMLKAELSVEPPEIWINRQPPQNDEPQPKEVRLTLTVTNTSRTTFSTVNNDSCIFRFWVLKGRTEVWRSEQPCLEVLTRVTIEPGRSISGSDIWRIADARELDLGEYTAFGEFIPTGLQAENTIVVDEAH
jgi:hypothetical protein